MKELKEIAKSLVNANLQDVRVYDTRSITPLFDYTINATATSNRQLNGVVDLLKKDSKNKSFKIKNVEGDRGEIWLLVDLYSVLVNVFLGDEREKYDLDNLWIDLPQIDFEDLHKK